MSNDLSSLSTSNWTLLSNVIHAFDRFMPIKQTRETIDYLSTRPLSNPEDTSHILSMFGTFYSSAESFISSSADFQILSLEEKSSLYQRNLHGVLHVCACFLYKLSGMFESSSSDKIILSTYGYDVFQQTKRIVLQIDYDITITKLLLFILAFSSNCYMVDTHENMDKDRFLHGTFRLFGSQNAYVEILWKYLTYRYDYYDASLRFARLIKHLLDLMKISENAQETNEVHHNFIDEVTVLTEQSLIISENEVIPLWGKT